MWNTITVQLLVLDECNVHIVRVTRLSICAGVKRRAPPPEERCNKTSGVGTGGGGGGGMGRERVFQGLAPPLNSARLHVVLHASGIKPRGLRKLAPLHYFLLED